MITKNVYGMQNSSNWLRMKMITSMRYSYFSKKGMNVFHQYSEFNFFFIKAMAIENITTM